MPPLFQWLVNGGGVPQDDAYRTFNMGIGLIIACAPADVAAVRRTLASAGEPDARVIGEIVSGNGSVEYA